MTLLGVLASLRRRLVDRRVQAAVALSGPGRVRAARLGDRHEGIEMPRAWDAGEEDAPGHLLDGCGRLPVCVVTT